MNPRALSIAATLSATLSGFSAAHADPDCAGPGRWPASMTFAHLKNARVLTNDDVDFSRTASTLIASQKIGADLYRQVFLVKYYLKDGRSESAIAVSDASNEECSMSDVKVYRIVDPPK
jgi:hypothetical protein